MLHLQASLEPHPKAIAAATCHAVLLSLYNKQNMLQYSHENDTPYRPAYPQIPHLHSRHRDGRDAAGAARLPPPSHAPATAPESSVCGTQAAEESKTRAAHGQAGSPATTQSRPCSPAGCSRQAGGFNAPGRACRQAGTSSCKTMKIEPSTEPEKPKYPAFLAAATVAVVATLSSCRQQKQPGSPVPARPPMATDSIVIPPHR